MPRAWCRPTFKSELGCAITTGGGISMPSCLRTHVKKGSLSLDAKFRQHSLGNVERTKEVSL